MSAYLKSLFSSSIGVWLSACWATIVAFIWPEESYKSSTYAILIIMALDLVTRFYALSKQNGGLLAAIAKKKLQSNKFFKGTFDKLFILAVVLVIGGAAYKITTVDSIAEWLKEAFFALMFFRDVISIFENLRDAGVGGLDNILKVLSKKYKAYIDSGGDSDVLDDGYNSSSTTTSTSSSSTSTDETSV